MSPTAFTDIERALLKDFAHVRKLPPPEDLSAAFRLVAAMGGHLNCNKDGPPSAEISFSWNGQAALSFTAWMLGHSVDAGDDSAVRQHNSWPDGMQGQGTRAMLVAASLDEALTASEAPDGWHDRADRAPVAAGVGDAREPGQARA